ncbi:MAG: hypothetical protein KME09_13435 [Pleurocapsa minor HA4230-MV1]|jgi:hypothetical protein|nr:hypothetical protein [Pleurocapsa minor HA4230-MV1]
MSYHSKQLTNGRWGIFINSKLIATIGCPDTCQKIIYFLENRLSNQSLPVLMEHYGVSQYFHDMKLRP